MYKKNDFFLSGFSSSFLFLFLLLLKLLPPPPKSAFLSIDFFNLPHFIKTLKYSLWNVCALCPQRRRPPNPPFARPGPPKSKAPRVGPGRGRGEPGHQDPWPCPPGSPGRGLRVSPAPSPGPAPHPPCKSMYLVRASLNSEVMTPGRPSPQALTRPVPANTPFQEGCFLSLNNFLK